MLQVQLCTIEVQEGQLYHFGVAGIRTGSEGQVGKSEATIFREWQSKPSLGQVSQNEGDYAIDAGPFRG